MGKKWFFEDKIFKSSEATEVNQIIDGASKSIDVATNPATPSK